MAIIPVGTFRIALMICGFAVVSTARCAEQPAPAKVKTGNLSTVAIGRGAKASINVGGYPMQVSGGRSRVTIERGDIHEISIGEGASASVDIPFPHSNSEEQ
jgi:hypothetical protein